tara:strand:- start:28 stop:738 length:711 start_codon:yes stop_codon:yes gene_type:complete
MVRCNFFFGKYGIPKKSGENDYQLFTKKCDKYYKVYNGTEDYNQINNLKGSKKLRKIEVKNIKGYEDHNFAIFSYPSNKIEEQLLYLYISLTIKYASIPDIDDFDEWSRRYLEFRLSGRTHNNIRNHFYFYYIKVKSINQVSKLIKKAKDDKNKIHYKKLYELRYKYVKRKYGFKKLDKYLESLKTNYNQIIKSIYESKEYKILLKILKKKGKNRYELDIYNNMKKIKSLYNVYKE